MNSKAPPSIDDHPPGEEVAETSEYFIPAFRKRRLREASNAEQALPEHYPPPPRVELEVASMGKPEKGIDQRRAAEQRRTGTKLRHRHRQACFGLALVETMPVAELPDSLQVLKLPEIDHASAKAYEKMEAKKTETHQGVIAAITR